jgi:hypothetical protein
VADLRSIARLRCFRLMAYVFDQVAHATERLSRCVIIAGHGYCAGSAAMHEYLSGGNQRTRGSDPGVLCTRVSAEMVAAGLRPEEVGCGPVIHSARRVRVVDCCGDRGRCLIPAATPVSRIHIGLTVNAHPPPGAIVPRTCLPLIVPPMGCPALAPHTWSGSNGTAITRCRGGRLRGGRRIADCAWPIVARLEPGQMPGFGDQPPSHACPAVRRSTEARVTRLKALAKVAG